MYNYDYNYDYKDKKTNIRKLNDYMLAKTLSMFEYEGLPPSIPVRELERLLQINGYAFITKAPNGKLYAFSGGLGGLPCPYGNPTEIVIANPALEFYKTLKLKTDGVLIRNDDLALGLMPLYGKHNAMLVENDINLTLYGYSSRMQTLISASDDKTKDSAQAYVNKVVDGDLSIIAENALFDGVKVHSGSLQSNGVTGMIEYHQYIKSAMFNEIGLSASFNMKKERLITAEVDQQDDGTFPYVYNMMKCRLHGIERINTMFGTEIDIDFGSVWNFKNKRMVDDIVDNTLEDDLIHEDMVNTNEPDETTETNKINDLHPETDLEREMLADLMADTGLTEDEINNLEISDEAKIDEDINDELTDDEVDELSDDISDELLDEIIDEDIEVLDEDTVIDTDDDITDDELLELEQKLADLDDDLTDEQIEELSNEQAENEVVDDAMQEAITDTESESTVINITINQEPINENDSVDVTSPVIQEEVIEDELVATIVNEVLEVLDTDTISDLETVNTSEEDENETK